jgi:hypothetical protein
MVRNGEWRLYTPVNVARPERLWTPRSRGLVGRPAAVRQARSGAVDALERCQDLGRHGVGRLGGVDRDEPAAIPVVVDDGVGLRVEPTQAAFDDLGVAVVRSPPRPYALPAAYGPRRQAAIEDLATPSSRRPNLASTLVPQRYDALGGWIVTMVWSPSRSTMSTADRSSP